jgi:hypothetical protein
LSHSDLSLLLLLLLLLLLMLLQLILKHPIRSNGELMHRGHRAVGRVSFEAQPSPRLRRNCRGYRRG